MSDHQHVEGGLQGGQDVADILVRHHRNDPHQIAEVELLVERPGQRRGAGRIVCGVDEHRRRAADPLESPRAGHGGETGTHRVDVELALGAGAEERLDGGQRKNGVVGLMLTVQRQEHLVVHTAEALQGQQLTADGDLPVEHRELRILPRDSGVGAHRLGQQHLHGLGRLAGDHRDGVGRDEGIVLFVDDARLLTGDLGQGVTEIVGVVHIDRGDHRHRSGHHIGGVPAPTETGLDDRDIDRGVGEGGEGHRGEHLELAHPRTVGRFGLLVDKFDEGFDLAVGRHVLRWRDRLSVDRDALGRRLQVRAGGAAGAPVQRDQQGIDDARHRCLAVGTGDVDRRIRALRRTEQLHQGRDAGRARFDLGLRPTLVEQVLDLQQCRDLVGSRLRGGHRARRSCVRTLIPRPPGGR